MKERSALANRRKSTIGASPLDNVVPRNAPGTAGASAGSGDESVQDVIRQPKKSFKRVDPTRKEHLTVHVPARLSNRVKNAVY